MAESMNRIMVKTIVKKAIRDLKTDPERTIRNLVDMALQFSDSRFQKHFFASAQRLLANESSGYYALAKDTVAMVDEEALLTCSMNLGYNGLYEGAKQIREQEAKNGYNIPWTIALVIAEGKVFERHHRVIGQGEAMGIHTWLLFSCFGVHECLDLAAEHPDSAFVVFCDSAEIDQKLLDRADDVKNIAWMISLDADADAACDLLRRCGMLYGLSYTYAEADLEHIESGELMQEMEQLRPAFSVLRPHASCPQAVRDRVYAWVTRARLGQEFRTIPWELYGDTLLVDEVISDNPCWVGFDEHGQLNTENGVDRTHGLNIFLNDLSVIFQRAFPKKKEIR